MKKALIINSPNISMLEIRGFEIYGNNSIGNVEKQIESLAKNLTLEIEFFQSNHEGQIIDKIQNRSNGCCWPYY
jgi:3-dehydroquinate dehydratase-2